MTIHEIKEKTRETQQKVEEWCERLKNANDNELKELAQELIKEAINDMYTWAVSYDLPDIILRSVYSEMLDYGSSNNNWVNYDETSISYRSISAPVVYSSVAWHVLDEALSFQLSISLCADNHKAVKISIVDELYGRGDFQFTFYMSRKQREICKMAMLDFLRRQYNVTEFFVYGRSAFGITTENWEGI